LALYVLYIVAQAKLQKLQAGSKLVTDEYAYLFVPGLFNEFYPGYLREAVTYFDQCGALAVLSGARGDGLVKDNAVRILAEVEALHWRSGKRVVLVGHSKGGVDSAACLSMFEHRLRDVVRGVVLVQSPYGGSAIATDLLAEPSLAKTVQSLLTKLVGLPSSHGPRLIAAINELDYQERQFFLAENPLPGCFPCLAFHSATYAPSSLLYAPAAYFRRRYNCKSDGLVAACDAEVPGRHVVRYGDEFDHLDSVFPLEWSPELLKPTPALSTSENKSPVAGRLIVQTSTVLNKAFKTRTAQAPSQSHLYEALVALLLEQPVF